jgi:putative aminopeptidase FrvX
MPYETVVLKTIEYLAVPSVVGHEQHFLRFLEEDFKNLGLSVKKHDGLLEISGAKPQSNIICAHVDRHGLISMGDGQYGYAAQYVRRHKYNEESKYVDKTLEAISARFDDEIVFAYNPETGEKMGEGIIKRCTPCMEEGNSYFSVDGMEVVPKDIPLAYARSARSNGKLLKGQIDNVVSLGVIYVLFQNGYQGTALLSCEEEIGKSWIHITNWLQKQKIETKNLFILDTSPYRETDQVNNNMVVLRNRDKSGIFNADLTNKIKMRCAFLHLPFQVKDEYFMDKGLDIPDLGSTELGKIVLNSENRWSGATIQIPTIEYHTSYETTTRGCIESYYALLQNILVNDPITV